MYMCQSPTGHVLIPYHKCVPIKIGGGTIVSPYGQEMNLKLVGQTTDKHQLTMDKANIFELLVEQGGANLCDLRSGNSFLPMTLTAQVLCPEKIDKLIDIELKH